MIFESDDEELQVLIESILDNSLVPGDIADVYWQISDQEKINSDRQKNTIYSQIKSELNSWQVITYGLAQLYTMGIKINWEALYKNSDACKISLPTYPFQRSIYWLE